MLQTYKRFASGPLGLFVGTLVFTTTAILSWKWGLSPILKRRNREINEGYAEYLFQERQGSKGQNIEQ